MPLTIRENFTPGSIPFAGASRFLSESPSLFWDNTNKFLGVGGTPTRKLHVIVEGIAAIGTTLDTYIDSTAGSGYSGRKARGTFLVPRRALSGDVLSGIAALGAQAPDNVTDSVFTNVAGQFRFFCAEDFTASACGTRFTLQLCPIGSTSLAEVLRIDAASNYYFGGGTTIGSNAAKVLVWLNGTAPTSNITDSFHMYAADQAAGNSCPHIRTESGTIVKLFQGADVGANDGSIGSVATQANAIRALLQANGLMA